MICVIEVKRKTTTHNAKDCVLNEELMISVFKLWQEIPVFPEKNFELVLIETSTKTA